MGISNVGGGAVKWMGFFFPFCMAWRGGAWHSVAGTGYGRGGWAVRCVGGAVAADALRGWVGGAGKVGGGGLG